MADEGGVGPHQHGVEALCEVGERVYGQALREGRVAREDVEGASCLIDLGLLHPDVDDLGWLVPAAPGVVAARLLGGVQEDLAAVHRTMAATVGALERFAEFEGRAQPQSSAMRLIEGKPRIRAALQEASVSCTSELLAVQPDGIRPEATLREGLPRDREMVRRGVRMRSLYTHAARHGLGLQAYFEELGGASEARTLEEVVERLVMFDRTVAFIPASEDRSVAMEVRHPALIEYLAIVFERLWRLAVPMMETLPHQTAIQGISLRDHSVAALLAEGHSDTEIAKRLGVSVRTCRHHVRKLAEALGSATRTQLGVRIAQVGLDTPPRTTVPAPGPPTAR
ncbi:helix-turn-helix transcriptional regulator [Streptomyces sp. T-3]|nr:helix-turn-helix transcriptional regulator [Streptomyces sp. T-3]